MNRHTSQFPNGADRRSVDVRWVLSLLAGVLIFFSIGCGGALAEDSRFKTPAPGALWARDNLIAWIVAPFDERRRSPEERAEMVSRLGFRHYGHISFGTDIDAAFDAEIAALKRHGINPIAWWFPFDADDPQARVILEVFKRHHIQPQLWVLQSIKPSRQPVQLKDIENLSPEAQREVRLRATRQDLRKKTPQEQAQRVGLEADRIKALVKLAEPYGCKVNLYNHNGWFGMMPNEVAIIERLKEQGINDVGIVYNFSHARDELHDDTIDFPAIWKLIKPYTVAVNITGMQWEGTLVYPSQGDYELEMMRIIQRSGWKGHIGLIAEMRGDAEITLGNYLKGFDWLVAELDRPGSAGPRPFPPFEGVRTD